MTYPDHLRNLKRKILQQSMSVMVGAGFSKNVDTRFPSWRELLKDMIKEMYEDQIKSEYHIIRSSKGHTVSFRTFFEKRVDVIIADKGLLNIVSEFKNRRGYNEAIAQYIEERIPFLLQESDADFLVSIDGGKRKKEFLNRNSLILHQKLLRIPWNNVYTTNYDNILEYCIQTGVSKDLSLKIKTIETKIASTETKIRQKEKDLVALNITLEEKKIETQQEFNLGENPTHNHLSSPPKQPSLERKLLEREIERLVRTTVEYRRKLEEINDVKDEVHTVLTKSSELALKRSRNIIKLHGTLRMNPEDEYGFDNDLQNHYIISSDDFKSYPDKHEAFTQLMRISLLRESFCLIGFSGEDPNFLGWIGWVRDIIERKSTTSLPNDKIYLIDLSNDKLPPAKDLFYRNHRIVHLPLFHKDCVSFLENETNKVLQDKNSKKELLLLLFDYLNSLHINRATLAFEVLEQEEYKEFWDALLKTSIRDNRFNPDLEYGEKKYPAHLQFANRIPSIKSNYISKITDVLFFCDKHIHAISSKETRENFLSLVFGGVTHILAPFSAVVNSVNKLQMASNEFPAIADKMLLLDLKEKIWKAEFVKAKRIRFGRNTEEFKDEISYYRALALIINFEFESLSLFLQKWKPVDHWIMKKAGLLAFIDIDKSISLLKENVQQRHQEELYRQRLLKYFSWAKDWDFDVGPSSEYIRKLESEKLQRFDENIEYIIQKYNSKKGKYSPLGEGKFSISDNAKNKEFEFSLSSVQFYGLLIELGLPLCLKNTIYERSEKVYPVLRANFEVYPDLTLFFALQYSDEGFLRRLGQDYAHSSAVAPDLTRIFERFKKAYFSIVTPNHFKKGILRFFSELLVAIDPRRWESTFELIWNKLRDDGKLFVEEHRVDASRFVANCLQYIKSVRVIRNIVIDCLSCEKTDISINASVRYLYELSRNRHFKANSKTIRNSHLQRAISVVIQELPQSYPSTIFLLGNIHVLLNGSELSQIVRQLLKSDFEKSINPATWMPIVFFARGNNQLHKKIKSIIIKTTKIWDAGISEDEKTYSSNNYSSIPFRHITKTKDKPNSLSWTQQEIKLIYKGIESELPKIERAINREHEFLNYHSILEEMIFVMEHYSVYLRKVPSFKGVLLTCKHLHLKETGSASLFEGLFSLKQSHSVFSVSELTKELYRTEKFHLHEDHIRVVLYKVLMKVEAGLEANLEYITAWLDLYKGNTTLKGFASELERIIVAYDDEIPEKLSPSSVEEKLATIAIILRGWGKSSDVIKRYSNKPRTSRYNNVRQLSLA